MVAWYICPVMLAISLGSFMIRLSKLDSYAMSTAIIRSLCSIEVEGNLTDQVLSKLRSKKS